MTGAQNARILVKNQCRTKTTMSVFLVSVHVCEKIAIARLYALVGVAESEKSYVKQGSIRGGRQVCTMYVHGAQYQRKNNSRILGRGAKMNALLNKRDDA